MPRRSDTDQEKMASLALHHGAAAMPVVDATGHLLGVVGSVAMMDILRREHVEDLHRLAGVTRESNAARNALEEPPLRGARHRLPWLIVGLGGSVVATFIVARFETALAAKPALAFFMPGLVYLADAIGTQSEAVTVRGLSFGHVGIGRLIGNELRTGLLIGTVLALLAFPMVWLVFDEARLAAAVALALAGASIVASVLRLVLPWLLARFGSDPAYGSAPPGDDRAGCAEPADLFRLRYGHRVVTKGPCFASWRWPCGRAGEAGGVLNAQAGASSVTCAW